MRRRVFGWVVAGCAAMAASAAWGPAGAQEPKADAIPEALQIAMDIDRAYVAAYNRHSAPDIAALHTEDVDVAVYVGKRKTVAFQGRGELEKRMATVFADQPKIGVESEVASAKLITDSTLLIEGTSRTIGEDRSEGSDRSTFLIVARKDTDGKWRIAVVRDVVHLAN